MKIGYIVALLMIILLVGCATTTQPETPTETPPPAPEVPEELPEEPAVPETVTGEISVTNAGFDPAELTLPVGSTITILAVEGNHRLTIGGAAVPTIEEGSAYDTTLDKAGEVRIFDLFTKKSAIITVTEEAAEE